MLSRSRCNTFSVHHKLTEHNRTHIRYATSTAVDHDIIMTTTIAQAARAASHTWLCNFLAHCSPSSAVPAFNLRRGSSTCQFAHRGENKVWASFVGPLDHSAHCAQVCPKAGRAARAARGTAAASPASRSRHQTAPRGRLLWHAKCSQSEETRVWELHRTDIPAVYLMIVIYLLERVSQVSASWLTGGFSVMIGPL